MPKETLSEGEFLRVQDAERTMIYIQSGTIRVGDSRIEAKNNIDVEAPRFWEWIPVKNGNPDMYIYGVEDSTINLKENPTGPKGSGEGQFGEVEL